MADTEDPTREFNTENALNAILDRLERMEVRFDRIEQNQQELGVRLDRLESNIEDRFRKQTETFMHRFDELEALIRVDVRGLRASLGEHERLLAKLEN